MSKFTARVTEKVINAWDSFTLTKCPPEEPGAADFAWPGRNPNHTRYASHLRYLRNRWFLNLSEWAVLVADELNASPNYYPTFFLGRREKFNKHQGRGAAQNTNELIISCYDSRLELGFAPAGKATPIPNCAQRIDAARAAWRKQDYIVALKELGQASFDAAPRVCTNFGLFTPRILIDGEERAVVYWAQAMISAEAGDYHYALNSARRLQSLMSYGSNHAGLPSLPGYIRKLETMAFSRPSQWLFPLNPSTSTSN